MRPKTVGTAIGRTLTGAMSDQNRHPDTDARRPAHAPIVVVVTDSPDTPHAVRWAAQEALLRGRRLEIFAVLGPDGMLEGPTGRRRGLHDVDDTVEALLLECRAIAMDVAAPCGRRDLSVHLRSERGSYVRLLAERTRGAELMVIGRLGVDPRHPGRIGGARAGLVRGAHCPVVQAIRPVPSSADTSPVAVPLMSDADIDVLGIAAQEALRRQSPLLVVRAADQPGTEALDTVLTEDAGVASAVAVQQRWVHPDAITKALVLVSETSQMMVTRVQDPAAQGRLWHRHEPYDGEAVLHMARCPVMMVPRRDGIVGGVGVRLREALHV